MLGATRGTGCPHWLGGLQAPSEGTGLFFRDSRDTALPSESVGGNVQPQRSTAPIPPDGTETWHSTFQRKPSSR